MALIIICVAGPGSTGKTTTIQEFTRKHLGYERSKGDVLGIFPMPRLGYAVGVTGKGDTPAFVLAGLEFLTPYKGLRAIIVACRSDGQTKEEIERFAKKSGGRLHWLPTEKVTGASAQKERIQANVRKIRGWMPR